MTDLGYKPIFDVAQEESKKVDYSEYFETFHDHPELFHFIMAPKSQYGTDDREINLAREIHPGFSEQLIEKGPSKLGNGSSVIDGVESRHIVLMTWLMANLGLGWRNVVEIGGGYGNCLRLVSGLIRYDNWTVIDLDYISELQKWFLFNSNVDLKDVDFLYSGSRTAQNILKPYLILGTHSLSEMSLDDFIGYYLRIIRKARWFFYATHDSGPSIELLQRKQSIIDQDFYLFSGKKYEGGDSTMYLFKNKRMV